MGLDQLSLRSMGRAVGRGDWLHLFPESRVNYTGTLGTLRWGVGKVICDAMRQSGGRSVGAGCGLSGGDGLDWE